MKPRSIVGKFPAFGKTVGMSMSATPSHLASVPAYWSAADVGI